MKIKKITVKNFKALSDQDIDLNGASAIITAGNNKGKTSLLRGLIDRFQGEKPDIIVKQDEAKGFNRMELTDGSIIEWKFTEKNETFSFTTKEGIKQTTGVISTIGKRYFGAKFDIDKFLTKSRTQQTKDVQALLGINLDELDAKYKEKYDERTLANRELKNIAAQKKEEPVKPEGIVDIKSIKDQIEDAKKKNTALKSDWEKKNLAHQQEISKHNEAENKIGRIKKEFEQFRDDIRERYYKQGYDEYIDFSKIDKDYKELPDMGELKPLTQLKEPKYNDLEGLEKQLEKAYESKSLMDSYETNLTVYNEWVDSGKKARKKVNDLNAELEKIQAERLEKIKKAKLPKEFEMTDDGLLYNGLPLDNNQISSSAKYICALKLGSMVLGDLRTMHFDASYLDKNSLNEIQEWADKNNLQLLIERPDFEAGEIQYQITKG